MRVPPDARAGNRQKSAVRAYLRLLRTPKQNAWYGDLDPRSWRVVAHQVRSQHLGVSDVRRVAALVRAGRSSGRYLCTMPRSGTNWLEAMIACGLSLSQGGTGEFTLEPDQGIAGDDGWVFDGPRYGWPAHPQQLAMSMARDPDRIVGAPVFLGSHDPLEPGMVDYRRARPVVTVREPGAAARSLMRKEGIERVIAEPQRLSLYMGHIERFLTTWERRLDDPATAARTLVLRYEDLRRDPVAGLVAIGEHWDLGVDEAVWAEAAERCSWSAMAELAGDRSDTARISLDRVALPDDAEAYIDEHSAAVGHRFGYGTDPGPTPT